MGNKIITEEDFWICTGGAVPAQLQTTQLTTKQVSGHKYITINDKATSSWIDFGCKKLMWIMALLAAVLVVAIVATGGAALAVIVAAGAAAGAAGAVFGAVLGALICGQKAAPARVWNQSKSDLIIQGHKAITGDHTMTCRLFGETIRFAPNIKNWWQAIALGGLNYLTGIVEGALTGALIGLGGGVLSGAARLALPTLSSVAGNVAASFGAIGAPVRVLFGASNAANQWAVGDINTTSEIASSFANGAVPEAGSAYRIATGQAQPGDAMLLLYLLRLKAPAVKRPGQGSQKPAGKGNNGKAFEHGKGTVKSTVDKVKDVMNAGELKRTTFSVARVKVPDGKGGFKTETWVSSAGKNGYVPPRIRKAAGADAVIKNKSESGNSTNRFNDAEQTILREAKAKGATIEEIGATRDMCAACQKAFTGQLESVVTPLKKTK